MVLKPSWTDNLSGKTVTVQYESESAVVSNTLTMPQITESGSNDITFSVPYLLAEDFSSINQNAGDYDNPEVGGTTIANGDGTAIDLSRWGAFGRRLDRSPRGRCRRQGRANLRPGRKPIR